MTRPNALGDDEWLAGSFAIDDSTGGIAVRAGPGRHRKEHLTTQAAARS
jgi:hypothetical protein